MNLKKYLAGTGLLLILGIACNENTVDPELFGSLRGRVFLDDERTPAINVEITTVPATSSTTTDTLGNFNFDRIRTGDYSIVASLDGFETESKGVSIFEDTEASVELELTRDTLAPAKPQNPIPTDAEDSLARKLTLTWSIPNETDDNLSFNLMFFESNQSDPIYEVTDYPDTTFNVENLKFNTTYFWQVQAVSSTGVVTNGDLWKFTTLPHPDNPIVFTTIRDGNYEIYSSDTGEENLVRLTFTDQNEIFPQYSNDRQFIAFVSNQNLGNHVYMMNFDGSAPQRITPLPVAGFHNDGNGYAWSPDDGRILFSHYERLYIVDRNGSNLQLIATAPAERNFRSVDWAAQGNKIVAETIASVIYESEIYIMDADGSNMEILIDNVPGNLGQPTFSLDGSQVMYTQDMSGFENETGRQLDTHILVIDLLSREVQDLSENKPEGTLDLNPRFSPTGAEIIFVNVKNDLSNEKAIGIMDIDGDNRQRLFNNAEMPFWQ